MSEHRLPIVDTSGPPQRAAKLVDDFTPALINQGAHHLCPGCGEPVAMRLIMEAVEELELAQRTVATSRSGAMPKPEESMLSPPIDDTSARPKTAS